jgi:hypothetical protein
MSIIAFYIPGTKTLAVLGDATNNVNVNWWIWN